MGLEFFKQVQKAENQRKMRFDVAAGLQLFQRKIPLKVHQLGPDGTVVGRIRGVEKPDSGFLGIQSQKPQQVFRLALIEERVFRLQRGESALGLTESIALERIFVGTRLRHGCGLLTAKGWQAGRVG